MQLTEEGRRRVEEIAAANGVSADAAISLLSALAAGNGTQAQFSHPELGGMGQWSRGGMIMVGDMFNNGLKARVDSLCNALAGLFGTPGLFAAPPSGGAGLSWWPAGLGNPTSVGAQNDMRYAWFPETRRLVIDEGGRTSVYDTGDHRISGASQQQGSGSTLTFSSQNGTVRVTDLPLVASPADPATAASLASPTTTGPAPAPAAPAPVAAAPPAAAAPAPVAPAAHEPRPAAGTDVLTMIERLAELRRKDILTEEEYATKKAELLSRL